MAHDALMAMRGLEVRMPSYQLCDLGFHSLDELATRAIVQYVGQLIAKGSCLYQFRHAIVGQGISLLWWRNKIVMQPHDMPTSPTHAVANIHA